ncbi:MAG: DUF418 domain-containing protein [Ferruginibacter sp.]|nr:DUF418 domain-containing protein [Chitinophagaceae bacterium]
MSTALAAPVGQTDRITLLDSLRGIAILGILLMNIPGFGLPAPACYGDVMVMDEMGTINQKTWFIIDWIFEGSQRALFSMLFGAGIILFISRQEKKFGGLGPADYFFRRQLWLLVFGLFNAFILLWFWDILFQYACCGMIMFTFRKWSSKLLLIAAGVCLLLMTLRENTDLYRDKAKLHKGVIAASIDTTRTKLTYEQQEDLGAMTGFKEKATLAERKKEMESNLEKVRGDFATFYKYQSERSFFMETAFFYNAIWDLLLFMFIGMAFYKNGVLTGTASSKIYWMFFIGGMGAGLVLSWFRLQPLIGTQFNKFDYTRMVDFEFYEISRTLRSIGFFGLIMLFYKSGWFKWLFALMRPVGQMAFTNYLMQSFLCGMFFYGIGFGMFGKLERHEIYYVVAAVWILQIAWSHAWLRFFRFGPLEWCWRSLTYWKKQPFRKEKSN